MDGATSGAEPPQSSRKRTRLALGVGGGVLVVAIIAVVVALAAGGGGGDGASRPAKPHATVRVPHTNVSLQLGDVSTDSAGPAAQLSPEQSQAVMKAIGDYVTVATVNPLHTAKPAGDLAGVFDPAALARVTGVDRGVMVDEGLPKVTGDLDITAQPVAVVALADQNGGIVLATAKLDLDITGQTGSDAGPLHIVRRGDLVLAPDASGAWKVTSYNVAVARTGAGLDPTTTTVAPPTTTKAPTTAKRSK
jgi:hypothetical protein